MYGLQVNRILRIKFLDEAEFLSEFLQTVYFASKSLTRLKSVGHKLAQVG